MKRLLLFLTLLTFMFTAIGQRHYSTVPDAGKGNCHFYLTKLEIPVISTGGATRGVSPPSYVLLDIGDEVAIYDKNVLVGSFQLVALPDGSYANAVQNNFLAYKQSAPGNSDGYKPGNIYHARCWDASASTEYYGEIVFNTDYTPQNYTGDVFPETMGYRWGWV